MVTSDEWLAGVHELPALPAAVNRLLCTLDAQGSSARDIARVIEADPALSAKVLRLANSAAYSVGDAVGDVHRATVILGHSTIRGMAISYGLYRVLDGPNRDLLDLHFWGHSIAAALAAHEIARRLRLPDASDAFVTGLLHDVGQVILAHWFKEDYRALLREHRASSVPLDVLEAKRLGASHAQVGKLFLRSWGLPARLIHAVEYHHTLYQVPTRSKQFPALAELADTIAIRAGYYGLSGSNPARPYSLGSMRILRVQPEMLDEIVVTVAAQVPQQAGLIQIASPARHAVGLV